MESHPSSQHVTCPHPCHITTVAVLGITAVKSSAVIMWFSNQQSPWNSKSTACHVRSLLYCNSLATDVLKYPVVAKHNMQSNNCILHVQTPIYVLLLLPKSRSAWFCIRCKPGKDLCKYYLNHCLPLTMIHSTAGSPLLTRQWLQPQSDACDWVCPHIVDLSLNHHLSCVPILVRKTTLNVSNYLHKGVQTPCLHFPSKYFDGIFPSIFHSGLLGITPNKL